MSREEAAIYFNRGIEIASRIGEENLSRWNALLDLATAAAESNTARPQVAYRLARIAELTHEYDQDHFPWLRTVEALADLCGPSALVILSRWRDRRFGSLERLLPAVVHRLLQSGKVPATTPVALAGIVGEWDRIEDLQRALPVQSDATGRTVVAKIAYRYIRLQHAKDEEWQALVELRGKHALDFPDLDRLAAPPPIPRPSSDRDSGNSPAQIAEQAPRSRSRVPNWDALLNGADLTNAATLRSLYADLRTFDPPYQLERFFREALSRVKAGLEPEFVRAVASWPDFEMFELKYLLDALPSPLPYHLALRKVVRELVLDMCRREPGRVTHRAWYTPVPVEGLRLGGLISEAEITSAVLEGYATQVDRLGASELFQVLEPLASILSPTQAEDTLNFGLGLLDEVLTPEDGDGPWREDLRPPGDLIDALAGYIWAGLGSASASARWQHAHVVRAIIELGWSDLLAALVALASADADPQPFIDHRLLFYRWHARQWLVIGLARGAFENPAALRPAHSLLQHFLKAPHVGVRELAASTLQTLASSGEVDAGTLGRLDVNRPLREEVSRWSARFDDERPLAEQSNEDADDRYSFWLDIGPYWFAPLGRVFGLSQQAIERRVRVVIKHMLGSVGGIGVRKDARHTRKLFEEGETSHRHSSLPRADDALTYHSYHAMMMVAAELLNERPVHRFSGHAH